MLTDALADSDNEPSVLPSFDALTLADSDSDNNSLSLIEIEVLWSTCSTDASSTATGATFLSSMYAAARFVSLPRLSFSSDSS